MIKVSVLYPNSENLVFDKEYYLNKHVPLVSELLGESLKNVQVDFGLTNGRSDKSAIYVVITHLTFDSIESFQNIFPIHAEELLSDIPRFTNSRPQLQISEIII
jgi:uncharacterized protein (TIGR02118 family)